MKNIILIFVLGITFGTGLTTDSVPTRLVNLIPAYGNINKPIPLSCGRMYFSGATLKSECGFI